jgi:hypothetical protein
MVAVVSQLVTQLKVMIHCLELFKKCENAEENEKNRI